MKTIWNRIETWLGANAPEVLRGLNPPATQSQITEAEAILGISFPQDVRDTFLIHNGQAFNSPWLLDGWEFLPLDYIVIKWKVWKGLLDADDFEGATSEANDYTKDDWWNPLWIPVTSDGAGNCNCLDLDPGPLGKAGQIIKMWHDDAARDLVAPSYRAWLTKLVDDFEAGRYVLSEKYGSIVRRDV